MLSVAALLFCAALSVCGAETSPVAEAKAPYAGYPVSALQFGVWYGVPSSTDYTQVYGFKSGWPFCGGHGLVCGLEAAWLGSMTDYVQGLQTAPIVCVGSDISGLQASLISNTSEHVNGVQAGLVNVTESLSGVQFGLVNYAKSGVQVGLINIMEGGLLGFFPIFNLKI